MIDRFYLITGTTALLERLVPLGVKTVQLRQKTLAADALRQEVIRARDCCLRNRATFILNDYWQLALELGIDFVHLGQEDIQNADLGALRRAGVRIGISTHDEAELERALSLTPNYVALGPVYPTLLKKMKWAPQGVERVTAWKWRCGSVPLVAIGGLTPERAPAVLKSGADSLAVVTDIQSAVDPQARTKEWLGVCR